MNKEQEYSGWNREEACRILSRSMHLLNKCVENTETYLDGWLEEMDTEFKDHWDEVVEVSEMLKTAFRESAQGSGRELKEQFTQIKRLNQLLLRLNTILGSNPVEMVRLAEKLASLSQKTLQMGVLVAHEYGDLAVTKESDVWLDLLNPEQISQVHEWVQENMALREVMGDG